jgi:hypothetical protein
MESVKAAHTHLTTQTHMSAQEKAQLLHDRASRVVASAAGQVANRLAEASDSGAFNSFFEPALPAFYPPPIRPKPKAHPGAAASGPEAQQCPGRHELLQLSQAGNANGVPATASSPATAEGLAEGAAQQPARDRRHRSMAGMLLRHAMRPRHPETRERHAWRLRHSEPYRIHHNPRSHNPEITGRRWRKMLSLYPRRREEEQAPDVGQGYSPAVVEMEVQAPVALATSSVSLV